MLSIAYAKEEEALVKLIALYKSRSTRELVKSIKIDYDSYLDLQGKLLILDINSPIVGPRHPMSSESIFFYKIVRLARHLDLEIVVPILLDSTNYQEDYLSRRIERLSANTFLQVETRYRDTWSFLLKNRVTDSSIRIHIKKDKKNERVYRSIKQTSLHSK